MSDDAPERIEEARARAVWLRAAQLQAEAAHKLEERSKSLAAGELDQSNGSGLSVEEVRAAAVEAGIAPEFVELALTEDRNSLHPTAPVTGWRDTYATRLLRTNQTVLEFSRSISSPPAEVLNVMQDVLPRHPLFLTLRDTVGDDPLNGATLLFQTPGMMVGGSYTSFTYSMATMGIKELRFTLRPADDGQSTTLRLSVPLHGARRATWIGGVSFSGTMAAVGGVMGLIPVKAMALTGALVAGPIAIGAAALALGASVGSGALYRHYLRKSQHELEGILKSIDVTLRMGTGFRMVPPTGAGPDASTNLLGS